MCACLPACTAAGWRAPGHSTVPLAPPPGGGMRMQALQPSAQHMLVEQGCECMLSSWLGANDASGGASSSTHARTHTRSGSPPPLPISRGPHDSLRGISCISLRKHSHSPSSAMMTKHAMLVAHLHPDTFQAGTADGLGLAHHRQPPPPPAPRGWGLACPSHWRPGAPPFPPSQRVPNNTLLQLHRCKGHEELLLHRLDAGKVPPSPFRLSQCRQTHMHTCIVACAQPTNPSHPIPLLPPPLPPFHCIPHGARHTLKPPPPPTHPPQHWPCRPAHLAHHLPAARRAAQASRQPHHSKRAGKPSKPQEKHRCRK